MMDALKFIEERNRMCNRYWQVDGDCDDCPLVDVRECNELRNMVDDSGKAVMKIVEIVEKWSKEHPRKTRQEVFLKQWPETEIEDGVLQLDPCTISASHRNAQGNCGATRRQCSDCRREFWMQEVE